MPLPIDAIALTRRVWTDLGTWAREARLPNFAITSFAQFFESLPTQAFSLDDRRRLLRQCHLLFANFYVHAPFKRERGLPDPLAAIEELERRVETANEQLTDDEFHRLVRRAFVEQEDAHTFYGLPQPYAEALAFLPFQVKRYFDEMGNARYVVSKTMPGFTPEKFGVGAEIVGWSGEPFVRALMRTGQGEVGGNRDAFISTALARMTIRPLRFAERPESAEELIEFRAVGESEVSSILIPWGVGTGFDVTSLFPPSGRGVAEVRATFSYANLLLMNPQKCRYEQAAPEDPAMHSTLPQVFEFQTLESAEELVPRECLGENGERFGYVRIKSFQLPEAAGPVESVLAGEFARILGLLNERAPDGLVLDLRGNMGGSIRAAETMLQMISPLPIQPARFHWRVTRALRRALVALRQLRERFTELSDEERELLTTLAADYGDWMHDGEHDEEADDRLTSGQPITEAMAANEVGQIYQGAVVLLVDAFTYSAGDIFAGGFQDHAIGPVLGITETTGGGGAAKWNYPDFTPALSKATGVPVETLPGEVTLSMAVLRSSRVHAHDGQFIEDVGVKADEVHWPTRGDVLENNRDLMRRAGRLLRERRKDCRLRIEEAKRVGGEIRCRVTGRGYAMARYEVNGEPVVARIEPDGTACLALAARWVSRPVRLAVFGCDEDGRVLANARTVVAPEAAL